MKLIGPAIHPGEILADELAELGVTASDLARAISVPINRITQILNGKRGITADSALRLGQWFGSGPEIWLDLQKDYELRLAEAELGDALEAIPSRPKGPGDAQRGLF
jgi:antitoxin HigA-1